MKLIKYTQSEWTEIKTQQIPGRQMGYLWKSIGLVSIWICLAECGQMAASFHAIPMRTMDRQWNKITRSCRHKTTDLCYAHDAIQLYLIEWKTRNCIGQWRRVYREPNPIRYTCLVFPSRRQERRRENRKTLLFCCCCRCSSSRSRTVYGFDKMLEYFLINFIPNATEMPNWHRLLTTLSALYAFMKDETINSRNQ